MQSTLPLPLLILSLTASTLAIPLPSTSSLNILSKRGRSTGATVGLAVGIAVAALLALAILTFLIFHFRRSHHLAALNRERAILAGEKNPDGSAKADKFASRSTKQSTNSTNPPNNSQQPGDGGVQRPQNALKRNKSVKDRLMGPLYRGSTIELPNRPGMGSRDSVAVEEGPDGMPLVSKPWADNSPRPSFSSRRATRMMMMM